MRRALVTVGVTLAAVAALSAPVTTSVDCDPVEDVSVTEPVAQVPWFNRWLDQSSVLDPYD